MREILAKFISICGISIERIVLIEFSVMNQSLKSSLEDEKSYSIMKIEIFFEFPLTALPSYFVSYFSSSLVTSASKQTRDPIFIFLNESIFSLCFSLWVFFKDLFLLRTSNILKQSFFLFKNSQRNFSTFSNNSFYYALVRSIF